MEEEVIKTVLNELLQEFKELKQQQAETLTILSEIRAKVSDFEQALVGANINNSAIGCTFNNLSN